MWGKRRVEGIYAKLEEMSQKRLFFALYPKNVRVSRLGPSFAHSLCVCLGVKKEKKKKKTGEGSQRTRHERKRRGGGKNTQKSISHPSFPLSSHFLTKRSTRNEY